MIWTKEIDVQSDATGSKNSIFKREDDERRTKKAAIKLQIKKADVKNSFCKIKSEIPWNWQWSSCIVKVY